MQSIPYKKIKKGPTWRQRNRLHLETTALGASLLAPIVFYFCLQNDQTILIGICFALLVVGINMTAWVG